MTCLVGDPVIGCHFLNGPFFWDEADWIPAPEGWSANIVQGKSFLDSDAVGQALSW